MLTGCPRKEIQHDEELITKQGSEKGGNGGQARETIQLGTKKQKGSKKIGKRVSLKKTTLEENRKIRTRENGELGTG